MKRKRLLIILLFLPLLIFLYLIPVAINSHLTFFPKNKLILLKTFNEENKYNSEIQILKQSDDEIIINYKLLKYTNLAFAGIKFFYEKNENIDLSNFDYLEMELKSTKETVFYIRILSFLDGYSKPDDFLKYLYSEVIIKADNNFTTYKINFNDFIVPFWWMKFNKSFIGKKNRINLKKVKAFTIQAEDENLNNIENQLYIKKIEFKRNIFQVFLTCLKTVFFIYISILLLYEANKLVKKYKRIIKQRNELIKLHKPLEMENYSDIEARKIFDFIKNNYNTQTISLSFINRNTGISGKRISTIIKKYHHLSFKQYLNIIRLEESKRLLEKTDRQIIEIAYNTGYNNVTHFNRVFKKYFGVNPFEFRKKSIN